MLEKLKSRKLWAAILANVIGIGTALAGSDEVSLIIAGVTIAAIGNIAYMWVEGKVDAAAAVQIVASSAESISKVMEDKKEA